MPAPTIPTLPTVPARNVAEPTAYITIADTWAAALPPWGVAVKAVGDYAGEQAALADADAIATAADRVQTGLDRTAASGSASAASGSALAAAGSASTSAGWSATSTTSMALTAGSKSLTIQTGKQFTDGTRILVKRTSDPDASQAFTSVGTYTSGTGVLEFTLAADDITGSGTYTDWTVELSGGRGRTGTGVVPQTVGFTLTGGTSSKTLTVDADATISDLMGGGDATNADIVALALEVAALKGSALGLSSGVSDAFEDTTGVDAAGSTGEVYGTGTYGGVTVSTDQPAQTAASAPTGYVASASSDNGNSAWRAFDQNSTTTFWEAGSSALPQWLKRQFDSTRTATAYSINVTDLSSGQKPTAWTFEGSNDNSTWRVLDTRTGQSLSGNTSFSIENPGGFIYYRLNITASGGALLLLYEVAFTFGTLGPVAMSLRSVAYTALSAPATAMITVAADLNSGAVNTDLIAYASRDNGTTWTAITLTAGRTLADGTTIYSGSGSISAQPSGTNMKWRIDTTSDFLVLASAVVLQWS